MITQEQLKQLIHYNPDTGLFTWTVTRGNSCIKSNNNSGLHGVSWCNTRNKWRTRIVVDHKEIFLGRYDNLLEAACVRKSAELEYGFHINHGRCN